MTGEPGVKSGRGKTRRGEVGSIKRHATKSKRKQSQLQILTFHTPPWCNTRSVRQVKDEKKRNPRGRCISQLPKVHLVDAHQAQSGRGIICHPIIIPTHLAGLEGWAAGPEGGVCFVGAGTGDALRQGVRTEAALLLTGGGGTRVVPSRVGRYTPTARGGVGALQCVMAKLLTVGTLGELVEAEVSLKLKGSGKSGQAGRTGELLGFGAGNSDDDGGGSL